MADRDLNFTPTVTQVTPEAPSTLGLGIAAVGAKIAEASEQSKLLKNSADLQLGFKKMDTDFRQKYADDPTNKEGLQDLAEARKNLSEQLGENISPFYQRTWQDKSTELASNSDLHNEVWTAEQQHTNTILNTNSAQQTYLDMASRDGQAFGASGATDGSTITNYANAKNSLAALSVPVLGRIKSDALLKNFNTDYIKSFVSGVAATNPVAALKLLDSDEVKGAITDQEHFLPFKQAIENRALNFQNVAAQTEVLGALKKESDLFTAGKPLTYAQIQQVSEGLSPESKQYFLNSNGYGASSATAKLTDDQRLMEKANIYDMINQASHADSVDAPQIAEIQGKIFAGMNNKSLTEKEGAEFLTQLMQPVVASKEKSLANFTTGDYNPFKTDPGTPAVQEYYDQKVAIQPPEGKKQIGPVSTLINARNKVKLYDYYWQALQQQATANNITVGDIPNLPNPQQRNLYRTAQQQAINTFSTDSSAVPKTQPTITTTAITKLRANPEKAADFDAMFGVGAANRILGK